MAAGPTPLNPGKALRACRQRAGMSASQLADCLDGRTGIAALPRYQGRGARRQLEYDIVELERTDRYPEPRNLIIFLREAEACLHCDALALPLAHLALAEYDVPDGVIFHDQPSGD
jgi:hypothetical protein